MRSCSDTPKVSPYAPCAPSCCHLCLQCPPRPLGLTECLPHLLLIILSSWLPPPPAPLLVSCGSWDTPAFSRAAALLDPLHHCCIGWLHFFMLSPHGGSPSFPLLDSVQFPFSQIPIPNPPSSQQFLCLSLGPVSPFPHVPVHALLSLPEPGWGV